MIGVALGVLLLLVALLSPRHGWIGRAVRLALLRVSILREDMLGVLFRLREAAAPEAAGDVPATRLRAAVGGGVGARAALWSLLRRGEALRRSGAISLTPRGTVAAAGIVRAHRLWESYLVQQAGMRADHVHDAAMRLEHLTDAAMQDRLAQRVTSPGTDPHGKAIPHRAGEEP
jgi:hypothetical protein